MISIGYAPETGYEHVVKDSDPHPGAHQRRGACPCKPSWDERALTWAHTRPVPPPSAVQQALVALAIENCELRDELEEADAEREQLTARWHTAVNVRRAPRPYEGSLAREIAHAFARWRSYRR